MASPNSVSQPPAIPAGLSAEQLLDLYYYMRSTRSLEERLAVLYRQTKIVGGLFRSLGQEADEENLAKQEAFLANIFDSQSSAFYTSGHMLDDGMIDPRDTRKTLGFLLETVWEPRQRTVRPNSFGIARM